jgi:hypothetical protein
MHSRATVAEAMRLRAEEGLGAVRVARRLNLPVGTVRDWHAGRLPHHSRRLTPGDSVPPACPACGHDAHRLPELPKAYVYLLGLYLGDGCISSGPRGVYRLRMFLDLRYPAVIDQCVAAIGELMPANRIGTLERDGSYEDDGEPSNVEVSAYSKSWPCLFPQHGPGKKHERRILLETWQQKLAERWPEALLRGMIQSDGWRFTNTRGKSDSWSAPRYGFGNLSTDITSIFCTACDKLDLRWTAAFPTDERKAVTIYVSRKDDVARMDEFIGPKR